jgi:serpin B
MPHPALALILRHLRRAARPPGAGGPSDGELLERFAGRREEAAFEALLQRHGPMVWNVCCRVLANASDAEDAFQATFLVLVRKAKSIARRDSVGSWLHGVAYRVSLDARAAAARRRAYERQGAGQAARELPVDTSWAEVRQVLDEELCRLPEKYRAPLVLCYLEGKTNDEAASQLGWTRGTVAGRLSRARDLLRSRLTRRGLTLPAAALGAILTDQAASAAVPAGLLQLTTKAATTGGASSSVVALAEGVLHTMFVTRLKLAGVVLAVLLILGGGAGWFWQPARSDPPSPPPEKPSPRPLVLAKDPAQAEADRPALVEGNNKFALDLYARLRSSRGNAVYSPYSISTALAMAYAGARGQTEKQMAEVLHFTLPQERLHPAAGALVRDLTGTAKGQKRNYQLHVANALWGQKDYGFQNDFVTLTRTVYDGGLTEVDFVSAREPARETINRWVRDKTQNKIKELLKKDHLTPETRLVLTNAIYFKAEWDAKFLKQATRIGLFQVSATQKVKVPLMAQRTHFPYLDGGTFQMLDLPYTGGGLSMLILLPKKVDGLPGLEKALTADKLRAWHKKLAETQVELVLPKFKVTGAFQLKEVLKGMGLESPFSKAADFSGMNGGKDPLFFSEVVHQTFVDVNEEGTEAAGATAAVIGLGGVPVKGVTFRADHPFVFLVRDNRSGSILFVGRVADPTKA